MICEKNQKNEEERGNREMESQRDILRVIEKEIKKGSAPVAFAGLGFSEECYHLVDSQAIIMLDTVGRFCAFRLYKR